MSLFYILLLYVLIRIKNMFLSAVVKNSNFLFSSVQNIYHNTIPWHNENEQQHSVRKFSFVMSALYSYILFLRVRFIRGKILQFFKNTFFFSYHEFRFSAIFLIFYFILIRLVSYIHTDILLYIHTTFKYICNFIKLSFTPKNL